MYVCDGCVHHKPVLWLRSESLDVMSANFATHTHSFKDAGFLQLTIHCLFLANYSRSQSYSVSRVPALHSFALFFIALHAYICICTPFRQFNLCSAYCTARLATKYSVYVFIITIRAQCRESTLKHTYTHTTGKSRKRYACTQLHTHTRPNIRTWS